MVCDVSAEALPNVRIAGAADPGAREWTLKRLDSTLRAGGQRLAFATNGGIFGVDGRPLGLLVADGKSLAPLNTSPGPDIAAPASVCDVANFYCPPNGVFYVANGQAGILSTAEFQTAVDPAAVTLATQSGPMLVSHGQLARAFPASWRKRMPRNAACIRGGGGVSFVLGSDETQGSFATALRDSLQCQDALFLDGSISVMYSGAGPVPASQDFGSIIYVAEPIPADDSTVNPLMHRESTPYSRLTVRGGVTHLRTLDQLHQYYPGGTGVEVQAETPFEFGLLGLTVNTMTLHGTTPQQVDTHTQTIAVDWQAPIRLARRVTLRAGTRVGDYNMVFNEPHPVPGKDYGTHEFLIGATGALDLRVIGPLGVSIGGAWLFLPSASRMHFGYLSALGSYTVNTPNWLRRVLE